MGKDTSRPPGTIVGFGFEGHVAIYIGSQIRNLLIAQVKEENSEFIYIHIEKKINKKV